MAASALLRIEACKRKQARHQPRLLLLVKSE